MTMDFWSIIWLTALGLGTIGFACIAGRVIVKGYAEAKSLLDDLGNGEGK